MTAKTVPVEFLTNRETIDDVARHYGSYMGGAAYGQIKSPMSEAGQVLYDLCLEAGIIEFSETKNTARASDVFHKWMLYDCLVSAKPTCGTGAMWLSCNEWLQNPSKNLLKPVQELFNKTNRSGRNIDTQFVENIESCLGQCCLRFGKGAHKNSVLFTTQSAIPWWVGCHEQGFYDQEDTGKPMQGHMQAKLRARLLRTFEQKGMLPVAVPSP